MVNAATIQTETDLADLLARCAIGLGDPKDSIAWEKWQEEWGGDPPIARAHGEFFLAVCHEAFEVYIMDPRDFWFVRVDRLQGDVPEQAPVDMVHNVLCHFDWDRLMWRCRRIQWEDTWAYVYSRCHSPASDSSELSEILWSLEETNIERFDMAGAKVVLKQLFAFLADPANLSPEMRCHLQAYHLLQSRGWGLWSARLKLTQKALTEIFSAMDGQAEDTPALRRALAEQLRPMGDLADQELSRRL